MEGDVLVDLHDRSLGHHRVGTEGPQDHLVHVFAPGMEAVGAVERRSEDDAGPEVAQVAVARRAVPADTASGNESKRRVVAGLDRCHTGADLMDDAA